MDRLTALQVFAEVARRGSFTDAADALDLSRAKVTRQVAELESWLGARLLQRSTRRLALTEAGEAALARCTPLQDLLDDLQASTGTRDTAPHGLIRVTCSTAFAQHHLAPAFTEYLRRHPAVQIDLQVSDRTFNLIEDKIDLAIRTTNTPDPGLIARRIATCHSLFCAAPAYLADHGVPQWPADLEHHNCLSFWYFSKSHWRLTRDGREESVPVGGNFSANDVGVLLAAAEAGAGIAMLPSYLANAAINSGRLCHVLADWQPESLGLYALYASRRYIPATLRTLIDFLAERFGPQAPWDC